MPDDGLITATLSRLYLALAVVIILLALSPRTAAYSSKSLNINVFSDGYVHVDQTFVVDTKTTAVKVPMLSSVVSDLVATDQNGSPLSYGFSTGSNVTIYTLGASSVDLRYDTSALTTKNGSIWTLTFISSFNSTVVLPQLSTLISASGTPPHTAPYTIGQTGNTPELTLAPGTWKISYGVPLTPVTSTTTTGVGPVSGVAGLSLLQLEEAGVAIAGAVAVGLYFGWWRRRFVGPKSGELRPDDVQVLNFIQEKGGKVLEPEIRTKFALPKTSAWRQIKRLERFGYLKVTKVGSQNQIELVKERKTEA